MEVLAEIEPATDASYFVDYVLVAAKLHLLGGDSRNAEKLLSGVLDARPSLSGEDPFSAQAIHYLYGRALSAQAAPAAAEQFRKAADLVPGTALAEEARRRVW